MKSRRANTFEINGLEERRALGIGANAGDSVINVWVIGSAGRLLDSSVT